MTDLWLQTCLYRVGVDCVVWTEWPPLLRQWGGSTPRSVVPKYRPQVRSPVNQPWHQHARQINDKQDQTGKDWKDSKRVKSCLVVESRDIGEVVCLSYVSSIFLQFKMFFLNFSRCFNAILFVTWPWPWHVSADLPWSSARASGAPGRYTELGELCTNDLLGLKIHVEATKLIQTMDDYGWRSNVKYS